LEGATTGQGAAPAYPFPSPHHAPQPARVTLTLGNPPKIICWDLVSPPSEMGIGCPRGHRVSTVDIYRPGGGFP
jgi:hypothetical protein